MNQCETDSKWVVRPDANVRAEQLNLDVHDGEPKWVVEPVTSLERMESQDWMGRFKVVRYD